MRRFGLCAALATLLAGCFYTTHVTPDVLDTAAARETRRLQAPAASAAAPAAGYRYQPTQLIASTCPSPRLPDGLLTFTDFDENWLAKVPVLKRERTLHGFMLSGAKINDEGCGLGVALTIYDNGAASLSSVIECGAAVCEFTTVGSWN